MVCTLLLLKDGGITCNALRQVTAHDVQHGVPHNAVVFQVCVCAAWPCVEDINGPCVGKGKGNTGRFGKRALCVHD